MEIKDIQTKEKSNKNITIRTTSSNCKWMKDNNISPTKLFNFALSELKKSKEQNE